MTAGLGNVWRRHPIRGDVAQKSCRASQTLITHWVVSIVPDTHNRSSASVNSETKKADNLLTSRSAIISSNHLEKSHESTKNRYVNQKRNMCNLSPNIFSIHFCGARSPARPKTTINFSLPSLHPEVFGEKSTQETLFCVISFNLIQCIKSEDQ